MPATEFSIDDCEEAIIWTSATKQEVLKAIRSDETLTIYMNDDEGPKWLRGQMFYESAVIDVADKDHIENVAAAFAINGANCSRFSFGVFPARG